MDKDILFFSEGYNMSYEMSEFLLVMGVTLVFAFILLWVVEGI